MEEIKIEQRQENQSSTLGKLAEALSNAQSCIEGSKMDAVNPFFKSNYSTLASIWDACRKPLSSNGLSVVQTMSNDNGKVIIITTLLHSSGEWMRGHLTVKPMKDDPQAMGSAITYGRRYSLAAIAGISPEDDDAEGTMKRDKKKSPLIEPQSKTATDKDPLAKSRRMIWTQMEKITSDKTEWKKMIIEAGCPLSPKDWKKKDIDKLVRYLDTQEKHSPKDDPILPESQPSCEEETSEHSPTNQNLEGVLLPDLDNFSDELPPEGCYELVETYKVMIASCDSIGQLSKFWNDNYETILKIKRIETPAFVKIKTAFDERRTELRKKGNK